MENDKKIFIEMETATGRILGVVPDEQHGLFRIQYVDGKGGALPSRLQGRYTGTKFAEHALDGFIKETFVVAAEHTKRKSKTDQTVAA